jgi:hypothetical protein
MNSVICRSGTRCAARSRPRRWASRSPSISAT